MRFTRQLPPARNTLRVTLEVMLVVTRRFHTKAHLSHDQCIAFCRSSLELYTDKAEHNTVDITKHVPSVRRCVELLGPNVNC
ncbi:hypothetical protein NQZ68_011395 [Dissostichus eleginoides]|nr:hypothetical protein NQZ68_011395 [Dissostichus eleginoides]